MKFQYALDLFSVEEAIEILKDVHDVIDIVECGTPMILHYGVECVRQIHEHYPDLCILADLKICDGGDYEANLAFERGADIVTVMGFTNDETIKGVVNCAKRHGKKSFVDMMRVEDVVTRAKEVLEMGVDYVCIHNATDALDMDKTIETARKVNGIVSEDHLVIAGGINLDTVDAVISCHPEVMIVGTSVHKAPDKRDMILQLRKKAGI